MMSENPSSPDEEVQALADRQLDWEDEKRVRAQLEGDHALRRQYEEIVRQNKLLRQWWQSISSSKN